jgi:glycosyltransferase involved in cell wall biosynthesis
VTDISVIIPARNAVETISATLGALQAQSFGGDYEVVVVDDDSNDETASLARRAGARVVSHRVAQGPAEARNSGRRAAQGQLMAFTDADCEPTPDWLKFGWEAAQRADLVQGAVRPRPGEEVGPFDRTLWVSEHSPRLYETANLFVRGETFDAVGGFRAFVATDGRSANVPGLRPAHGTEHFGEDILFACEALRIGARFIFEARAEVYHAVFRRRRAEYVRERWRLRYMPAILREAPELRSSFRFGVFLSDRTARFDLAVAGLVLATATRRREPLALTIPYLTRLRRHGLWRRSAWRENAGLIGGDAMSLAALARGSVAARELLL